MSELTSPSAEPNYIARLALQSAPFNAVVNPEIFYKSEQIEQRLNLLLHLVRASDKVGLLFAEQGFGKSTLLTQIQHNKTDDLRICRIDGKASLTSMEIILQCLSAFGVDDNDIQFSNDYLVLLKDRLSGLRQLNITPLLLIDDIDFLSEEPLMLVISCLSWQKDDSFLLQAVFTSKRILPILSTIHGRLQQIDLPALSKQEVSLYLDYRLGMVGYYGESIFSSKDLTHCYRQTAGIPALINQWAHQHLLGMNRGFSNPIKIKTERVMPLLRWLALGLLVLSLILLLLFQDTINNLFLPETIDQIVIEKPFTSQDELLEKIILGEDKISSAGQAEREELESLVSELALEVVASEQPPSFLPQDEVFSQVQQETEIPSGIPLEAQADEQPQTAIQTQADEQPQTAIQTQTDEQLQTVIQTQVENQPKMKVLKPRLEPEPVLQKELSSASHQKSWILEQRATDYTFQLMGSWDKQEVAAFIEKYALTGDVAEFDSMRNGRVWYALIYGVYDNKQAALKASGAWPAPINTLPSWLRRFDDVQQQIKKKAP